MKIFRHLIPLLLCAATAFGQLVPVQQPLGNSYTDRSLVVRDGTANKTTGVTDLLFTTSANPGAPNRTLKIGSNVGDSQILIVGGSTAGNTANSFNFELHDGSDVLTQAWVTAFDLGLARWSTSYWSTLSSAYVTSHYFDPATNVTTFPNGLSATQLTSTVATGTAPFVVASTTLVANLHAATADVATSTTSTTNIGITNDTTTNATMFPLWVTANTGNLPAKVSSTKLSFNPSTGILTSTGFAGPLTGNVTGNVSGSSGSTTGNAATVTTNANLTGAVTSTGNATSLGSFTGSALATALSTALPETKGGTNQTTYTTGDILFASAANTLSKKAQGSDGTFLGVQSGTLGYYTPAGGGNVSNSGTPVSGQAAEWTSATVIQGVGVTGTGNYAKVTGTTLANPPISNYITLATGTPTYAAGKLQFDTANDSLTFYNSDSNVGLQIGQESWIRVRNDTGSTIANGVPVYISGAASGLPQITPANANAGATAGAVGLTTESITTGSIGFVTSEGLVNGIDTSAFSAGARLYLGTTAGTLTTTAPSSPNYQVTIGTVVVSNAVTGNIFVSPSSGRPAGTLAFTDVSQTFTGVNTFTPTARSSGVAPYFTLTTPADTGQTAATESIGFSAPTATRTWATTGTVALQRERFWAGPTYASAGASQTFTDAFNTYMTPPVAGTNAIFTRGHTLGIVDSTSAASSITGGLVVATTLGTAATSVGIGGGNVNAGGNITTGGTLAVTTSITTPTASFTALAGATTLLTLGGTGASASTFFPSTLDTTSSTTGAIRTSGGISAAKAAWFGTDLTVAGKAGFGLGSGTTTFVGIAAGTTAASSLRMAHGVAPSSPVNGDFWTTSTGFFGQISGATSTWFGSLTKTDVLQAGMFAADAGASDTYAVTYSPAITAYVTGVNYWFKANTANTGAATININALGAKTIVKLQGAITTTLADNDIRAGQWVELVYDGTNMQMLSAGGNAPTATAAGSDTYVQFNDGGTALGGDAGMTYNKTTDSLTLAGTLTTGSGASTAGAIALTQGTTQSTGTTNITIQAPAAVTSHIYTLPGTVGTNGAFWTQTTSGTTATLLNTKVVPTGTVVGTSDTQTLTNKNVQPRVTAITSSATPAYDVDASDVVNITALAAAITSMTSSRTGTPFDFQQLEFRIKDNGTARAITWGADFSSGIATLPTTTTLGKTLYVYCEFDSVTGDFMCQSTGSYP